MNIHINRLLMARQAQQSELRRGESSFVSGRCAVKWRPLLGGTSGKMSILGP
jgi:hypothetical protein